MSRGRELRGLRLGIALLACLAASGEGSSEPGLSAVDLSGDWYVLVHYKDEDSVDKSVARFRDFVWSIEQTRNSMAIEEYPNVIFSEDQELYRKAAMQEDVAWEPDPATWARIREELRVKSSATTRKRLTGGAEEGYSSLPALGTGGFRTMTFESAWRVTFKREAIRIEIVDSLSGGGLEGMEGSTVFDVLERPRDDELRGRYTRDTFHGTFRMVRSKGRRVVE
jgi:hypothetical protein